MIKKHLNSYRYALRGIWLAFRYEPNMAIHLTAALVVIIINIILNISKSEWLITLLLISIVWTVEIINTAIEKLADRVTRDQDPMIAQAKDLAAGAVLIVCIFSVICAIIIYWPYFF